MKRAQLEEARLAKGWSIERLAEEVGSHPATVVRWINGERFPKPLKRRRLTEKLEKTEAQLGLVEVPPVTQRNTTAETKKPEEPGESEDVTGEEYLELRLFRALWNYPRTSQARYHGLQELIILELKENAMDIHELSRREALKALSTTTAEYCCLSTLKPTAFKLPSDELLLHCGTGITACWYLRKGQEINFAAETVAKFIPTLKEITGSGSTPQRKEAAELLFQCFLLLSVHSYVVIMGAHNAVAYAQQAGIYANMAENPLLQIVALRTQSAAHEYAGDWKSALDAGSKAKGLLETTKNMPIPLLVESFVHAGLSNYQAFFGLKDDAKISLKRARAAFEAQPGGESAPLWIDYTIGALLRDEGRMHMHLGLYKEAISSFKKMSGEHAHDTSTPFGTRIEIMINQIVAELSRKDETPKKDWCIENWEKSLNNARMLGSCSKENKVIHVYNTMLRVWSEEQDVVELGQRLVEQKTQSS